MKIKAIAKIKKINKNESIKKKIIPKHTYINVKCFKYFKNVCYTKTRKTNIEVL